MSSAVFAWVVKRELGVDVPELPSDAMSELKMLDELQIDHSLRDKIQVAANRRKVRWMAPSFTCDKKPPYVIPLFVVDSAFLILLIEQIRYDRRRLSIGR